jgi:hypothetical protein
VLELKDFDCKESYDLYLEHLEKYNGYEDQPMTFKDEAGEWCFIKYDGIYYRHYKKDIRLLRIEILLKRILDGKDGT